MARDCGVSKVVQSESGGPVQVIQVESFASVQLYVITPSVGAPVKIERYRVFVLRSDRGVS